MGRGQTYPTKVKLFTGMLISDMAPSRDVLSSLEETFGPIDHESPLLDFYHSDYYRPEMGDSLKRKFVSFTALADLDNISAVKLKTGLIEKTFSNNGKRSINIDPGYVDMAKVVLFSTKDYAHRIHVDKGIFAEVTLYYKDRTFNPWPWTYPDYKTAVYIDFFNSLRENFKEAIEHSC